MHRTAWLRAIAATALVATAPFVPITKADAAAAHATGVTAPTTATVGQTIDVTLDITNTSTAPETAAGHTITDIMIVPSCGSTGPNPSGDCPVADVGAITTGTSAVGAPASACAGTTFTIAAEPGSTTGRQRLTPSAPVVLAAPGPGSADECTIELDLTIVRTPTADALPTAGSQTVVLASSVGTSNIAPPGQPNSTSFSAGAAAITIEGATPSLVTQVAEPEVVVGDPVADRATLSGGAEPSGTITFDLFGPDDEDCSGPPVASSTHPVDGAGAYSSSAATPTAVGGYRFVARYSGDADNRPVSGACNDPNESVAVSAAEPPGIRVLKTATPLSRPEPGGTFSFQLAVTNTSAVPLTLTAFADDVYGDVATQGTCTDGVGTELGPGDAYDCAFPGELTGNATATQTDVVTVTAVDDTGAAVTDQDDAVVSLTDVAPTATIAKTALPEVRVAPGGLFTFGLTITNTSFEPVTISALADDVYGDLGQRPGSSCGAALGTVLDPGEALGCTFEGELTGAVGAAQTDVVTVTVTDDDGSNGTAQDDATIRLVAPGEEPTTTTIAPPTATTRPATSTTRPPPSLARTGGPSRSSALMAGTLIGVGLLLTGLGAIATSRNRPVLDVRPERK
jgi:hypothetical protein